MILFVDTGVLLRAHDRKDPSHRTIVDAFRKIRAEGHLLVTAAQNMREFWNVSTRPTTARGGYGIPIPDVMHRIRQIERFIRIVPETPAAFARWKLLVEANNVVGAKVHDANLAAIVIENQFDYLLTLNPNDFRRYPLSGTITPAEVVARQSL